MLDRIYVSHPCYDNVRVVTSTVKTDHNAVIAYSGPEKCVLNKRRQRRVFRKRSPTQHALFLEHISELKIDFARDADVQTNFDSMHNVMVDLLDRFYSEREITLTSSDPPFVTPAVKAQLRRKNRLMRAGRTAEADAIAAHIAPSSLAVARGGCERLTPGKAPKTPGRKCARLSKGRRTRPASRSTVGQTEYLTITTRPSLQTPTTAHPGWNWRHPTIWTTLRRCACFGCWTHCDQQRLVLTRYRRGFFVLARLSSPHRSPVCSISRWLQVQCRVSERLQSY